MTGMLRVTAKWQGFSGAPGYSNFFFRDFTANNEPTQAQAQGGVDRVNTFLGAIQSLLPPNVNITVQPTVDVIEETNGQLTTSFTVPTPSAVPGTSTVTTYSAPTGAVITWRTAGVRNGRRVRGRTFLVPLATNCYQADGTLDPTKMATLATASAALANQSGTPDLGVWARPTSKTATDGVWWVVSNATVPDMAAVLRSRRD
jgi:hypothetical protein